jgi:hypothetical protein
MKSTKVLEMVEKMVDKTMPHLHFDARIVLHNNFRMLVGEILDIETEELSAMKKEHKEIVNEH